MVAAGVAVVSGVNRIQENPDAEIFEWRPRRNHDGGATVLMAEPGRMSQEIRR
jgi:hypothetical protein